MSSDWYLWKAVLPLGIGTLLIRCSFIFLGDKIKLSPFMRELFTYIPAAVLPALALPMVFFHEGIVSIINGKERLYAFLIAIIVSFASKNILITIVIGLGILFLFQSLGH